MTDRALVIPCAGDQMVGVLHEPEGEPEVGLIVVVAGGPQYRVGVNRQFVMLGREMARHGVATLRFDHRGVGDSAGEYRGYVDMSADIRAAVDALLAAVPSIRHVTLWGECESATAISFYAHEDPRVVGLFMVNPWVRTEVGEAKAFVKHYYLDRLSSRAFWQKLFSGKFDLLASLKSFQGLVAKWLGSSRSGASNESATDVAALPLPERLELTTTRFAGQLYIVTSGRDLVAKEFLDHAKGSPAWRGIFASPHCAVIEVRDADHTFSRRDWRDELFQHTAAWLEATVAAHRKA